VRRAVERPEHVARSHPGDDDVGRQVVLPSGDQVDRLAPAEDDQQAGRPDPGHHPGGDLADQACALVLVDDGVDGGLPDLHEGPDEDRVDQGPDLVAQAVDARERQALGAAEDHLDQAPVELVQAELEDAHGDQRRGVDQDGAEDAPVDARSERPQDPAGQGAAGDDLADQEAEQEAVQAPEPFPGREEHHHRGLARDEPGEEKGHVRPEAGERSRHHGRYYPKLALFF